MKLSGWGRYPEVECNLTRPRDVGSLAQALAGTRTIARGNGRAYGDCALNPVSTIETRHLNHMESFDAESGQLVAEAGVLLSDVITAFLPRGWFPAVTPGTSFVTLGGMVAADVHGKNHHVHGSFGNCVDWLDVMDASGEIVRCSRSENSELFEWTIGGMGLTGVILRVAFRLRRVETGWIQQTTHIAKNLDNAIELFETSLESTYSVAWIDCLSSGNALGRAIVMLGEHATRSELPSAYHANPFPISNRKKLSVPFDLPRFALNTYSVKAFNALYYRNAQRGSSRTYVDWSRYFYPLDSILNWNRMYGRKGFAQFQCVLPLAQSKQGLDEMLKEISRTGQGSFLAVLKRFGNQDSRFSFPMEGYTLALDFPVSQKTLALIDRLGAMTAAHGGRIYLAKDSCMTPQLLRTTDGTRASAFDEMRQRTQSASGFASVQSERLKL